MQLIPPLVSPLPRELISANPGLRGILNKISLPKTSPNWARAQKVLMNAHVYLTQK